MVPCGRLEYKLLLYKNGLNILCNQIRHKTSQYLEDFPSYLQAQLEGAKMAPLFIRLMTLTGANWSRDQRTVTMR